MHSSASTSPGALSDDLFPDADLPTTPLQQIVPSHLTELSPPNSQGAPFATTAFSDAATATSGANANGKRPLSTLDGVGDSGTGKSVSYALPGEAQAQAQASAGPVEVKTHDLSGYSWTKAEDEPGWCWKNKKAVDEANRAWDGLVLKDKRIGSE